MTEAEVVANGMSEVTGQNVRLERIDININSYRSFCADSSHAGSGRLSALERVPPPENIICQVGFDLRSGDSRPLVRVD